MYHTYHNDEVGFLLKTTTCTYLSSSLKAETPNDCSIEKSVWKVNDLTFVTSCLFDGY